MLALQNAISYKQQTLNKQTRVKKDVKSKVVAKKWL